MRSSKICYIKLFEKRYILLNQFRFPGRIVNSYPIIHTSKCRWKHLFGKLLKSDT